MLVQFATANFRSFRDRATLSMVATPLTSLDKSVDDRNAFDAGDLRLLKTAAIYGANASGKSNLIRALALMRRLVINSSRESQASEPIEVEPYLLSDETAKQPSLFEIVCLVDGRRYRYGFEVDSTRVVAEWLYHVPTIREARLFYRRLDDVTLSPGFREGKGIAEKTRANALFLSVVAQFNGALAEKLLGWFRDLRFISGLRESATLDFTVKSFADDKYRSEILRLIGGLDLGIQDIRVRTTGLIADELPSEMPDDLKKLILGDKNEITSILTTHRKYDSLGRASSVEEFELGKHESAGTNKLFALAGPIIDSLLNRRVLLVDELDVKLHTLISRAVIDLFHSTSGNPRNAQLVFTAQDTNLLDSQLFRRDQIWFTEKDVYEASHLISLVEYKPRKDASLEDNYLRGRYGGIPLVGELSEALSGQ